MEDLFQIFFGKLTTANMVLVMFLGLCPFYGVSKKIGPAISMGIAVTLVMVIASVATWFVFHHILVPFQVEFMIIVLFILVIASLVQMIEMTIKRTNATLYNALGIYLPLITTNCAILGITLINIVQEYTLIQSIVNGLGGGIGFGIALILMSTIREKLELADVPKSFRGLPIGYLIATMLAFIFVYTFMGVV
jgi:electron transport complex protein RnfA